MGITEEEELFKGERIIYENYNKREKETPMELNKKKEKLKKEYNSMLKMLIISFGFLFVFDVVLNYLFPKINFSNIFALISIFIVIILLDKWIFGNYELKLK